jgi:hypothetical protein
MFAALQGKDVQQCRCCAWRSSRQAKDAQQALLQLSLGAINLYRAKACNAGCEGEEGGACSATANQQDSKVR